MVGLRPPRHRAQVHALLRSLVSSHVRLWLETPRRHPLDMGQGSRLGLPRKGDLALRVFKKSNGPPCGLENWRNGVSVHSCRPPLADARSCASSVSASATAADAGSRKLHDCGMRA